MRICNTFAVSCKSKLDECLTDCKDMHNNAAACKTFVASKILVTFTT